MAELTAELGHSRTKRRAKVAATGLALAVIATLTVLNSGGVSGLHVPGHAAVTTVFIGQGPHAPYAVQAGVFRLRIVAEGADGGDTDPVEGGDAAHVEATIDVSPGQTLQVRVAQGGGAGGASSLPGGNGALGGGLSGVLLNGNPLVIAAGGGGAGGNGLLAAEALPLEPGRGGDTPAAGSPAIAPSGGCGAGGPGAPGTGVPPAIGGTGGGGGSCTSGGTPGTLVQSGQPGTSLAGGPGGGGGVLSGGGGGGGAGYFGGGGGGGGGVGGSGAGGGGGSSFVAGGASQASITSTGGGASDTPGRVEITEMPAECNDGVDNDDPEDVLADAQDPGCFTDPTDPATFDRNDNDETDSGGAVTECNDNVDNADPEDNLIDENDPGCYTDPNDPATYSPFDNNETDGNGNFQCNNTFDDGDPEDALADAADPGCYNNGVYTPTDDNERDDVAAPECSDGVDNADPEDALADAADPGCHTDRNPANFATYNPRDTSETDAITDPVPPGLPPGGGAPGTSDLSISQRSNIPKARKGQTITFTVAVTNGGPSTATNVVGAVQTSSNLQVVSVTTASGLCVTGTTSTNIGGCTLGSLAPGQTTAFSVIARVLGRRGRASSLATVQAAQTDPDPTDNDVTTEVKIKKKKTKKGRRR